MTRYYEYDRCGGSEKYSEITEEEYLIAREEKGRYFISFGSSVLECEKAEYIKHFQLKDHFDYTQKDKNGRKVLPESLENVPYDLLRDQTLLPIDELIAEKLDYQNDVKKLHRALEQLKPDEREIIVQLYWKGKSQSELARDYGIERQTLHIKLNRILVKLLKFIKNEK